MSKRSIVGVVALAAVIMEKSLHFPDAGLRLSAERTAIHQSWAGRGWAVLLLLAWCSVPCLADKPVTVVQLEQILAAGHDQDDAKMATKILDLFLIERLSATRLSRDEAGLPGPLSRQALMTLADISGFLNPPDDEIPALAKPDTKAQREMIALTLNYVNQTIHQLPNFFATRVTTSLQDDPWYDESTGSSESYLHSLIGFKPLHQVGRYSATVLYRRGREVVHESVAQASPRGLTTSGEFGPILGSAMLDAAQGHLAWSHWEQGVAGPMAVYQYAVSAEKSHYSVSYCCVVNMDRERVYFQQFSAYRGEIAIDPSNGTILRLSFKAMGFKKNDPLDQANILVEYGPVEIGGKTYICPLKSVALSLGVEKQTTSGFRTKYDPLQTSLNDVVFEQYHLYRANSTVLPGYTVEQLQDPPDNSKPPN